MEHKRWYRLMKYRIGLMQQLIAEHWLSRFPSLLQFLIHHFQERDTSTSRSLYQDQYSMNDFLKL